MKGRRLTLRVATADTTMNDKPKPSDEAVALQPDCSASRLWRVTVEYELIVVADDEWRAALEGEFYAGEDGSEASSTMAHPIKSIEEVPQEWRDAIPFAGERGDERTVRERVTP